jgi:AcrR family transcriptional regulator
MSSPVKRSLATDYPRRRRRAETTRRRVVDAARDLFIERGYVGTTVEAIAARADVAPETVYAAFGTKRALLSTVVDVSIAGDVDAGPVIEQAWVAELRDEPDPHRRAALLARQGTAILKRRHAIDEVVRGAAASDPEIAALLDRGKAQRRAGQLELLRVVVGDAGLRPGLDLEAAADILYALGSPETYRSLVIDRGWSSSRFEGWYADAINGLLADRG